MLTGIKPLRAEVLSEVEYCSRLTPDRLMTISPWPDISDYPQVALANTKYSPIANEQTSLAILNTSIPTYASSYHPDNETGEQLNTNSEYFKHVRAVKNLCGYEP